MDPFPPPGDAVDVPNLPASGDPPMEGRQSGSSIGRYSGSSIDEIRSTHWAPDAAKPSPRDSVCEVSDCPLCARCAGLVGASVAEAARAAVRSAFAELQPALLREVAGVVGDPLGPLPAELNAGPQLRRNCTARLTRHGTMNSEKMEDVRTLGSQASSGGSRLILPSSHISSGRRPTVQTLQAELAAILLETSGLGTGPQRPASSPGEASPALSAHPVCSPPPEVRSRAEAPALPNEVDRDPSGSDFFSIGPFARRSTVDSQRSPSSRRLTGSQVLQARCDELAQEATRTRTMLPCVSQKVFGASSLPLTMRIVGMLEWASKDRPRFSCAYAWITRMGVACAIVIWMLQSLDCEGSLFWSCDPGEIACRRSVCFVNQLPVPIAAMVVSLPFFFRRQQMRFEETFHLVRDVAQERGFGEWEARQHRRDAAVFVLMWVCSVAGAAWSHYIFLSEDGARILLHACLIGIFSAVTLCLTYGIVHICRSLIVMIDAFCSDVTGTNQLQHIAHVWNLTQAVLRKTSTDVETCLLLLCVLLASSVPMLTMALAVLGAGGNDMPALLPGFCVNCGILYALLLAATVTEKCVRVPALINAISFGSGTERARQYTVDYIAMSAAGFYIYDTRLNTAMVIKFMYVWCIVVTGVLTRMRMSGP
mmetsp:Transcript_111296/g.321830  ORF Transcript_111296/g.321830 Transcript_111296/m.321830 type:complete len:651 (+) Transcript_111296:50-2002(+)